MLAVEVSFSRETGGIAGHIKNYGELIILADKKYRFGRRVISINFARFHFRL
ncbi:MAG: hypothetical protein ACI837_001764, partial [Crocinitomicaceae bacterium]